MPLDTGNRATLQALSSPSMFHGAVENAFAGVRQRSLWRVDLLGGQHYLLILSAGKPDLSHAIAQFAPIGAQWETKDYTPLLNRVRDGTRWRFHLCANPTYSVAEKGRRGRVCAHSTTAHQREWLLRQSERHGFALDADAFDVTGSRWYQFGKGYGQNKINLLAVTYDGILTVTNAALLRDMLIQGIGREKAYGVGLMTLVRAEA